MAAAAAAQFATAELSGAAGTSNTERTDKIDDSLLEWLTSHGVT